MIITYDKNPALSVNGKLQSLAESVQLALNEQEMEMSGIGKRADAFENELHKMLDAFYPVGSYYETSDSNFDPNTEWGGTWSSETIKNVHIVDEGTSGNWTYRKWSDGTAECWEAVSLSSGSFTATGNVYYRSASGYSFPSSLFNAAPVVDVNADMGNVGAASALNITSSSFAIYTMSAVSTARAVSFSVYAVGTWKTYSAPTAIYRWHRTQ